MLHTLIAGKAAPAAVSKQAHKPADSLLTVYPMPMVPSKVPGLKHGTALYQSQYAFCRGNTGHTDDPLVTKLSPPPIALASHQRTRERSAFALRQIITRDVEGTSMSSFAQPTSDDR